MKTAIIGIAIPCPTNKVSGDPCLAGCFRIGRILADPQCRAVSLGVFITEVIGKYVFNFKKCTYCLVMRLRGNVAKLGVLGVWRIVLSQLPKPSLGNPLRYGSCVQGQRCVTRELW